MKASGVEYLIDAGPLVGAFFGRDPWHLWSRATLVTLGASEVYTTEVALAEAAHHLKPYLPAFLGLMEAVKIGRVRIVPIFPEGAERCAELAVKYAPRMDLGDASLVILSERFPTARLITVDMADFAVYRRSDGRPVPLITPKQ